MVFIFNSFMEKGDAMARKIVVAAIQLDAANVEEITAKKDKENVVSRIAVLMEEAARFNSAVVCMPELSLTQFFPNSLIRDNDYLFDNLPSPLIEPIIQIAKKHEMITLLPYAEADGDFHYNSCIVLDCDGSVIGKYRKMHVPAYFPSNLPGGTGSYERLYFAPGNLGFPVFEIKRHGMRIGIQICADRMFPEGYRILALKGAEIVFNPTCYGTYGRADRIPAWGRLLQARAYENGVFVVAPNKAGVEGVRENVGRSLIISPNSGELIKMGPPDGDVVVYSEIDLEQVSEARKKLPWWLWRRPHEYSALIA
jgi:predicted amidohydrolase